MNAGILLLLGVTVAVLGCFARFFVVLARRARAHDILASHVGRGFAPRQAGLEGPPYIPASHVGRGFTPRQAGREGPPYAHREVKA